MDEVILFEHQFVDYIPEQLEEGVLYIAMEFATASHLCSCGCKQEVVTPLAPTEWKLIYDGESVTLYPSIGNWSFTCRSHYWIRRGRIVPAPNWSEEEIWLARRQAAQERVDYYGGKAVSDSLLGIPGKGANDVGAG